MGLKIKQRFFISTITVGAMAVAAVWLHPESLQGRIALTVLLAGAVLELGRSLAKNFDEKINTLVWYTREVSSGTFYGKLKLKGDDELTDLGRNINSMASRLTDQIDALTREKTTVEAVLAGMIEGVLVTDKDGRVILANKSLRETFALRKEDMLGKSFLEVIRNIDISKLIQKSYERHSMVTGEVEIHRPGATLYFMAGSVPLVIKEEFAGTVLVLHDVTRLKALERVRRDFVANVTHELKTPIAAIQGFSETLLSGAMDDRENAGRFIGIIESNSRRLSRLIEDLLMLSRIELGEVRMELNPVSVKNVCEEVLALLQSRIDEKRLVVAMDIPSGCDRVEADRDKLYQILLNIMDNAVKYTPEGGRVSINSIICPQDDGVVKIAVSDTGIGIPSEMVERVGERFFRVDPARSRELGGTGLGLAIVKHLVMAHGGEFKIESELGKGTVVTFAIKVGSL